ncbi:hypothetical protein EYF80_009156 [Liparis tanakae]|uniref:Uncharacterized protein n=1 Tax=Liparis tanakae TaxID=230148 RepID=A0A4Z2ISS4_9TELE|nr:hypothetical protein EYF80_009156 [Liparis tanakae]
MVPTGVDEVQTVQSSISSQEEEALGSLLLQRESDRASSREEPLNEGWAFDGVSSGVFMTRQRQQLRQPIEVVGILLDFDALLDFRLAVLIVALRAVVYRLQKGRLILLHHSFTEDVPSQVDLGGPQSLQFGQRFPKCWGYVAKVVWVSYFSVLGYGVRSLHHLHVKVGVMKREEQRRVWHLQDCSFPSLILGPL